MSDNITIQETGGSGALAVISFGLLFKTERQQVSAMKTATKIAAKVERKITKNPTLIAHPGIKTELTGAGGEI